MSTWFSISLKSASALLGIGEFARLVSPEIGTMEVKLIALGFCILFVLVNLRGVGHAGRMQVAMVLGLIAVLTTFVIMGLPHVDLARLKPLVPHGGISVIATAGFVFISYGGLTKVASVAEEVRDPGRNIPLGMGLSLLIVSLMYVAVIFVTVGVLEGDVLMGTLTPLSTAAGKFVGMPGVVVLSLTAMLAFVTTANAGIMAASRDPMAMSRDGLLPGLFCRVGRRFKTPHISILFTGGFMAAAILLLDLEQLVKLASTLMILVFMFVNLSVIIMRESHITNYMPEFRSPMYPWIQLFGIISCFFLIVEMGVVPIFIATLFLTGSFAWYWLYARARVERESGLLRYIKRIADKALFSGDIESELKTVLRERDEIVEDRFDRLVGRCKILDVPGQLTEAECFREIAAAVSDKLSVPTPEMEKMLKEREDESCTALSPGLALPHLIVEGEGIYEMVLLRCKDGVVFSGSFEPVRAVFALFASMDQRNFHLRALMAIAQISQGKDFLKRWLRARNPDELRDVVLLGKRKRGA